MWLISICFSRSYCYTVSSAIGIIMSSVCPCVRPSVCDAVHCVSHGGSTGLHRVPSRHVPLCPFRHFSCRMYRLATKRTEKNESMKTWWRVFETDNQACTGRVLRSVSHWLRELLNFGVPGSVEFGCVHKRYLLNRIVRTSRSSTCNRNRFDI